MDELNGFVVRCLECGNQCVHHGAVEYYWRRKEDDKTGTYVRARELSVQSRSDHPMNDNPSFRRGGIVIGLHCESGCKMQELHIIQHKGSTHIEHVIVEDLF